MLFRAAVLDRIRSGDVTLAFRYWRRPTVKAGGRLRTPVGVLAIDAVEPCAVGDITERDSRRAGADTRDDLLTGIDTSRGGTLYRIRFHLIGPDPRAALRSNPKITKSELRGISDRLARFDETSRAGAWTRQVLQSIASRDGITAAEIATKIGVDKDALKRNIRKLKELGLTESLPGGYRISERGRKVLAALAKDA